MTATLPRHLVDFAGALAAPPASMAAPEEHDVRVGGLRMHYYDWGGPADRPVVLVHGGGLTAHTWDAVALGLRDEFRCVALDLRGHGDSDWADDYRLEAFAGDLGGFVAALGLDAPVLVGMSLGGQSSLLAAAAAPDPRGLVLVDVGPDTVLAGSRRIVRFVSSGHEFASVEQAVSIALAFNPRRDREVLRETLRNNLREREDGRWTWKYDSSMFEPLLAPGTREHNAALMWAAVPHVRCPVLVLRGSESDVFSEAQAVELAGRLPNASWQEVEGAGHSIQGDNPLGTIAALAPFLRERYA